MSDGWIAVCYAAAFVVLAAAFVGCWALDYIKNPIDDERDMR